MTTQRWILYEDRRGPHRHLLEIGECVVGRAPECDLAIDDFGLSRRHARLVIDERTVRIIDLKSKGGTQVNAVPVVEALLASGDNIRLGHVQVRFVEGLRRALIDQIAGIAGRPPELCREDTPLGELKDSFIGFLYVITTIERECAVQLPRDDLMRIHTIGDLVDLIERSRSGSARA